MSPPNFLFLLSSSTASFVAIQFSAPFYVFNTSTFAFISVDSNNLDDPKFQKLPWAFNSAKKLSSFIPLCDYLSSNVSMIPWYLNFDFLMLVLSKGTSPHSRGEGFLGRCF